MNSVPMFGLGDAVRVMQTDDAVDNGIANKHGVVVGGEVKDGVQLFYIALDAGRIVPVAASGLMARNQTKPPKQAQD